MSNIAYSELLPDVLPDLPGAPSGLVLRRIRDTFIEFCRETQVWEHELDAIKLVEGRTDYEIEGDQPACADIDAIKVIERFADREKLNERKAELQLHPFADFTIPEKWVVRLTSAPNSSMAGRLILLQVSLRPTLEAEEIFDRIYLDWYEHIAQGVKFKMMQIPGKEYTDAQAALYHDSEYQRGIAKAKIQTSKGRMNANLQVSSQRRFTMGGGAATTNVRHPDRFFIA